MNARINVPSVVLGAAGLGLVLLAASAVAPQSVATALATLLRVRVIAPVEIVGMPAAENIVNFDSFSIQGTPNGSISLPPSGVVHIYTVPTSQRLVITDWVDGNSTTQVALIEDLAGVLTTKVSSNLFGNPALPLAFEPGSMLFLSNVNGSQTQIVLLSFSGYLEEL